MKTLLGISVVSAALAAALVVSCAPVAKSFSRSGSAPQSQLANQLNAKNTDVNAAENLVSGDWTCAAPNECTFSKISISGKNGSATLESSMTKDPSDNPDESAKIAVTRFSDHVHVDMSLTGSQMTLSGDISLKNSSQELILNISPGQPEMNERYVHAAVTGSR